MKGRGSSLDWRTHQTEETLKKEKDSEKGGESVRTRMRKERERVAAFQIVLDFALRRILLHPAQVTLPCYLPTYLGA